MNTKTLMEKNGNVAIVWAALLDYRERCMPQDEPAYNFAWADIKAAMESIENDAEHSAVIGSALKKIDLECQKARQSLNSAIYVPDIQMLARKALNKELSK